MYSTVSRSYGPWQSYVHYSQSVDHTDRDNHICTNITVSDILAQYLNYAESCLKTHSRHPAQCSAAEDMRSWWPWRWWWSLVQDCCAGPPLRIPLLAVTRGTILTPFYHDRSLNIMSHRNLLESVTRFFLASFHSFFLPEIHFRVQAILWVSGSSEPVHSSDFSRKSLVIINTFLNSSWKVTFNSNV